MRAHPSAGVHISGTTKLFSPGHDFPSLLSLMQNINASHAVSSPCSRKVRTACFNTRRCYRSPSAFRWVSTCKRLISANNRQRTFKLAGGRVLPAGAVRRHHNLNRIASTGSDCRHCRQNDHPMYSVLCHLLSQSRAVFHGRHQPAC